MPAPKTILLAGDFPPTLNTAKPATELKPNETPDSYGFSLLADGKIKKGTVPTGTTRIQKAIAITEDSVSIPYLWHGNRLWNITDRTASTASTKLTLGALNYNDVFYPPNTRFHKIPFDNDAQTILAILPIEPDALAVLKTTGGYIIRNLSDTRGFFQTTDIRQEFACKSKSTCAIINNILFTGNATDGITSYENYKINEATRPLRPDRATIGALAMTVDYERQWLILGSTYVLDVTNGKWFNFSGSSFRYTSRQVRNPNLSPFSVNRVIFEIEHGDTTTGKITYQIRHEKSQWSKSYDVRVPYSEEKYTTVSDELESQNSSQRWQIRITDLSATKYIKSILIDSENLADTDYGE